MQARKRLTRDYGALKPWARSPSDRSHRGKRAARPPKALREVGLGWEEARAIREFYLAMIESIQDGDDLYSSLACWVNRYFRRQSQDAKDGWRLYAIYRDFVNQEIHGSPSRVRWFARRVLADIGIESAGAYSVDNGVLTLHFLDRRITLTDRALRDLIEQADPFHRGPAAIATATRRRAALLRRHRDRIKALREKEASLRKQLARLRYAQSKRPVRPPFLPRKLEATIKAIAEEIGQIRAAMVGLRAPK